MSFLLAHCLSILVSLLLIIITTSIVEAQGARSPCYLPDGSNISSEAFPCSSSTSDGQSACCRHGSICLTNGLCYDQQSDGLISRSSCTDRTWRSQNCPKYCQHQMVDDDCPIIPAAVGGINGRWCCNWLASNGSCAFGDEFTVSPIGQVELVANVAAFNSTTSFGRLTAYASSGNAPTSRITSVPSLATNGSTTADTSIVGTNETLHVGCTSFTSAVVTNGSTTTASGDQYGATVTVTAWSSTWSDSGQSATQCNTSYASILAATNDTRRTDFAIAAGIGFPLGLAFLGVLCLYLRERQRRRKEQNEMIELQVASRKEPQRTTAAGIASRKHNNNRGHGRRLVGRAVELPATVHELPETSSVDIPIVFGPSNDPWI